MDLLHLNGVDLRSKPLAERRQRLLQMIDKQTRPVPWLYPPEAFSDGAQLLAMCGKFGLEGIVSKRLDKRYVSGDCRSWVKVKCEAWKAANTERWSKLHQ